MKKVICIAGAKGVGKSTTATLISRHVPHARQVAFATPIKTFLRHVFDLSDDQLYGPSDLREQWLPLTRGPFRFASADWHAITGRFHEARDLFAVSMAQWAKCDVDAAQRALTDWWHCTLNQYLITPRGLLQRLGTDCGRSLDPDIWVNAMNDFLTEESSGTYVITDARFNNEFQAARAQGWDLWHIERGERPDDPHPSEVDMFGDELTRCRTHHYVNDGSLDDLRAVVALALT